MCEWSALGAEIGVIHWTSDKQYSDLLLCNAARNLISETRKKRHEIQRIFIRILTKILFRNTYLLTYSMEQSPSWEANWFSASQEIPPILWNSKVHYRFFKCPPPALSWVTSIQSMPLHPTSIRSILILPSHLRLGLPSGLFPSCVATKTLYTPLLSP